LYIETIEPKVFRTFLRLYSLFKSEILNANIKLTLRRDPIRSIMTFAARLGICGRNPSIEIATPAK
jgi:hypothetical protein